MSPGLDEVRALHPALYSDNKIALTGTYLSLRRHHLYMAWTMACCITCACQVKCNAALSAYPARISTGSLAQTKKEGLSFYFLRFYPSIPQTQHCSQLSVTPLGMSMLVNPSLVCKMGAKMTMMTNTTSARILTPPPHYLRYIGDLRHQCVRNEWRSFATSSKKERVKEDSAITHLPVCGIDGNRSVVIVHSIYGELYLFIRRWVLVCSPFSFVANVCSHVWCKPTQM
jgi:hypothetical protein